MSVPAKKRKQYATVRSGGKNKFPVYNKRTARSAKRLINHAKPPLTPSQKARVLARVRKFGVSTKAKKK